MKTYEKILVFLSSYIQDKKFSPTFDEIVKGVGLRSKSTVHRHLHNLRNKQLVSFIDGSPRTLILTDKGKLEALKITGVEL
jgi:repressor LexA